MCVDRLRWLRYFRLLKTISLGGGEEIGGGGEEGRGEEVEEGLRCFQEEIKLFLLELRFFAGGGGHFLKLFFFKHIVELHTQTFLKPEGQNLCCFFFFGGGGVEVFFFDGLHFSGC